MTPLANPGWGCGKIFIADGKFSSLFFMMTRTTIEEYRLTLVRDALRNGVNTLEVKVWLVEGELLVSRFRHGVSRRVSRG